MPKFRKKPLVIEAVQFEPLPEYAVWRKRHGYTNHKVGVGRDGVEYLIEECGIRTASGFVRLQLGDWICTQTVNGVEDKWPCKPDIFAATYEAVEEPVNA